MDLERFIADCRAAHAADRSHKAVREVVARAVSEPGAVLKWLGAPKRGEVQKLYHSPELTILNVVWAPYMTIYPHNHMHTGWGLTDKPWSHLTLTPEIQHSTNLGPMRSFPNQPQECSQLPPA